MDLPCVGVSCMLIECELNWEYTSNYVTQRFVTFAKVYTGLRSLTLCSSIIIFVVGRYVWRVIPSSSFQFPCCKCLIISWFYLRFHIHVCYLIRVKR